MGASPPATRAPPPPPLTTSTILIEGAGYPLLDVIVIRLLSTGVQTQTRLFPPSDRSGRHCPITSLGSLCLGSIGHSIRSGAGRIPRVGPGRTRPRDHGSTRPRQNRARQRHTTPRRPSLRYCSAHRRRRPRRQRTPKTPSSPSRRSRLRLGGPVGVDLNLLESALRTADYGNDDAPLPVRPVDQPGLAPLANRVGDRFDLLVPNRFSLPRTRGPSTGASPGRCTFTWPYPVLARTVTTSATGSLAPGRARRPCARRLHHRAPARLVALKSSSGFHRTACLSKIRSPRSSKAPPLLFSSA